MATMILAKKFIFSISRSFPQTQSLFLRSFSSSTHKFSRATTFTASVKEKMAETGEITTVAEKTDQEANKEKQKNWEKPPKGWHVLSTDASARKDIAGIGGLIRDQIGSIVVPFAARIPTAPTHVIEMKATVAEKTDQEANKEKQKNWEKPPEGWHVLSTDGSARKDISGIGGLIRDQNGSIVAAFAAGILSLAPIPVIEIKAIVEGVKIAMITKGVTKLIIYSDSMQAVDVINGKLKPPCEARDDIILLNSMKVFFTEFEVRHVCREANRPADFLASFCENENSLVFNGVNIPQQLKVLASQDATGRM